jgi:glutathione S-transferase
VTAPADRSRTSTPGQPLKLLLGQRRAGSPSIPVWLGLHRFDLPFEEISEEHPLPLGQGVLHPPDEQVPVLLLAGRAVWGPLPVLEQLAEHAPGLWPARPEERARARAAAAEIAAGFPVLRALLPSLAPGVAPPERLHRPLAAEVQRLRRLIAMRGARADGPFLFGGFSIADAMLAGLGGRLLRDTLGQDKGALAYLDTLERLPALRGWMELASEAGPVQPEMPTAPEHLVEPEAAQQAQEQALPAAPDPPAPPPPPPQAPPPPRPRLDEVDRPPIAYLDETPSRSWRSLPIIERIGLPPPIPPLPPVPTRNAPPSLGEDEAAARARRAALPERPVRPPAPAPAARVPRVPPALEPPAEAEPPPAPVDPPKEGEGSFMFRLRRPGTASGDPDARPINRFARAISTGRLREEEPEPPQGDGGGSRRPSSIKPIGFSTQRRR